MTKAKTVMTTEELREKIEELINGTEGAFMIAAIKLGNELCTTFTGQATEEDVMFALSELTKDVKEAVAQSHAEETKH